MEEKYLSVFRKLHRLSLLIGAMSIVLPLVFWSKIPQKLPMHYNAAGVVDHWSDKSSLILLFFVIAMLMGMMSIVVYFVKSNMESKYSSQQNKTEMAIVYPMVIVMNLVLQCIFAYITFCSVTCRHLGTWFLPVSLLATFAPLGYMVYKVAGGKSKTERETYKQIEKEGTGIVYRTAIDLWLGALLGGCEVFMLWLSLEPIFRRGQIDWAMLCITIGMTVIIVPLFAIKYVLYPEHLLVSMCLYGKARIRYKDIVEVKETYNPLSGAAMSLRRIQIDYVEEGVHRMVLISPVHRKQFLRELDERR